MALDPLKFAVQITDEATTKLTTIKNELDKLQGKDIAINVSGNLGDFLNLFKEGVDTSKFSNLKDAISNALSGIEGLNKAAREGNFADYAAQIGTAAAAVTALSNAIAGVNNVVGTNEGFQKFMVSIGEVVTRVDAALKQLNETSSAGAMSSQSKSIEKAKYELYQFDSLVKQAEQTSRLGKQFGDVDTSGLDKALEKLQTFRAELKQISETGKGEKGRGFDKFALQAEYKEAVDQVKKLSAEQHSTEMNLGRYNAMLKETDALWDRIIAAWKQGSNLGVATANMKPAEQQAGDFYRRLQSLNQADLNNVQIIAQLAAEFQRLKGTLTATAKEQEKLNAATEKQKSKDAADSARKSQKENEAWAKSMRDASAEANKLGIELNRLRKIEQAGSDVGADTTKLRQYISTLETYKIVLDQIAAGNRTLGHASDWISGKSAISGFDTLGNTGRLAKEAAGAVRELTAEKQKSASATTQLTNEEQRLAQALNQTAESAKGQSQVLSDLKSMAMQYLGVWGGQQFLHNIIEIGGQLEMQRMSIGAILQNQSQANDLFEKIKGLAVQSPFGVVELDQMTKQLTAYGFKYSELFDMTKRLADISAATGTGVDRLALALGHVRSEAALSGYTLRQFSMGNVPLLAKLSEKLGKTTQEIRKMVRAKEISYEDVEGVIKDLTNEGGMFYNMQETISQSVKARFKNVKDAMAIMYGEMAEGATGDALKGVADALMEATKNWKDMATVIGTSAAIWATHRAAIMLHTAAIGKNNAAVLSSLTSYKAQQAQALKLAWVYRERTAAEMQSIATSKRITAMERLRALTTGHVSKAQLKRMVIARQEIITGNALALSQRKLTAEDIAKQVATAKLTKTEARRIIIRSNLTDVEKTAALNAVAGVRTYGRLTGVINGAALAAQRLGMALKSLVFNPAMLGMAAISGIVELWQRNNQEVERAGDLYKSIFEASQEALKNTRTMMGNTGINAYQFRDGKLTNLTNSFGVEDESRAKTILVKPEFDPSTAQQVVDEWSQYIREYAGTPNKILNNALKDESESVRMLKDQFDLLYESVDLVMRAQKELADLAWVFAASQDSTGEGVFNEDVIKNIQDYEKALKTFNRSIVKTFREHGLAVKKGIDAARKFDEGFAGATEGMTSYIDMLQLLLDNEEKYDTAVSQFKSKGGRSVWYNLVDDNEGLANVKKTMEEDVTNYIESIKSTLRAAGKNPDNLDDVTKEGLMEIFTKQFIGSLGDISDKTRKELIEQFAEAFNLSVDEAEELTEKRLADWQKRAGDVFIVNQNIKVKTKTVTSLHEFAEEVQKDLKEKQEYITKEASHIRQTLTIQTGIKFNMQKIDASELDKVIIQLAERVKKLAREGHVDAAKALLSVVQDELMPFRDVMKSIDEDKKWLKQEGYPEKDPTKDKSKNKKDTKKTYKDPVAEEWKERIRLLKDANSLYKEWNKRSGEDAALNRVREQYGDIFEKWRTDKNVPWTDFKAEDIIEYRKYVQKIVDEAQKRYDEQRNDKAKNYGKEAEAVLREGKKLLDDIDRYDFDEKAREFKTSFEKALDDMTRKWEIFTSVRNATGNKLLAFDMANIDQESRNLRNAADALKDKLADEMQRVGGNELLTKIPFSIDIDEEKLRDQFKAALGDSEKYATTIDGLVEAYKKWQKLQQDVVKNDIDVFAKLMGSVVSYSAQIRKINDELAQQKTAIANSGASESQQREAIAVAESQADWKKMKLSADYSNLYNKTIAMSRIEFENAANAVQNMIDKLRDLGTISPDEYLQEVEKLNKARMEWSTTGFLGERGAFGQFISGGNQGLMDYYQQRADAARRRADYLKDTELVPSAAQKNARAEAEHYQKLYEALKKLTDEAQKVVTAFQTLQSGIDLLGGLFDSLGMEGAANAMSDAGGILGGALQGASSLSALGPYGMAAGAAIGLIGGIAQVHDKALERHINKLREDVKGIEANTELIAKSRERTLGYDMGDVRRQMSQQYAPQQVSGSGIQAYIAMLLSGGRQNQSMYDFYTQNSQGTGYQQEYDNLVEQREKYLEILKDQQSKKKKSNDEIEETKAKIAELDDKIAYFSQDLAKELWSIDIKGWADQLSDALASAFENGENMAKAYRDTVTQIIQQMMQKMMQMAILEPMFERLQKQLFGENGKGGVFDPNNPRGSMSKVTAMIADFFGKGGEGEKAITASMEFMTAFQRGMQNAGLTVLNEASNTLSSSMQGTTEETSGLLAGYVNALRQDVSVNRILLTQFVSQMWPDYMDVFANQVTAVQNIDTNVQVIMTMMQMGTGAMYNEIAALRSRIDNVVLGIDKFSIK